MKNIGEKRIWEEKRKNCCELFLKIKKKNIALGVFNVKRKSLKFSVYIKQNE